MPPPKLFISYSHDSDQHREKVLSLSERLREDGYATSLDRYVNGTPEEGWPRWMSNQLEQASIVLVVCTETYYHRFRGHEEPGMGKGADWEGALITHAIYESRSRSVRFVPVVFDPNDQEFIPEPLRGSTYYSLDSRANYDEMCDFFDGIAGVEPRPVGEHVSRERRRALPLRFTDELGAPNSPDIPFGIDSVERQVGHRDEVRLLVRAADWLDDDESGTDLKRREFLSRLAHFLPEEKRLMDSIHKLLTDPSSDRIVMLGGPQGYGKSTFSAELARQLVLEGRTCFQVVLSSASDVGELLDDLRTVRQDGTVVILDNCHRCPDLLAHLWRRRRELNPLALLLVTRLVDFQARQATDCEYIDVQAAIDHRQRFFDLRQVVGAKYREKVLAIIRKRRVRDERRNRWQLTTGTEDAVVKASQSNLMGLTMALNLWRPDTDLASLVADSSASSFQDRYLRPDVFDDASRELLVLLAAVAQFEVRCEIPDKYETAGFSRRKEGLIRFDRETGDVTFSHPAFAQHLIRAVESRGPDSKTQLHKTRTTLDLLKTYIRRCSPHPKRFDELLLALSEKKPNKYLIPLAKDPDVQRRIAEFFRDQSAIGTAIEFLFKTKHFLTRRQVHHYLDFIILRRPNLFANLLDTAAPLLAWTKLTKVAHYGYREDTGVVQDVVKARQLSKLAESADFSLVCYCAWSLLDIGRDKGIRMLDAMSNEALCLKASNSSPVEFTRSIERLRKVDVRRARHVLRTVANTAESPVSQMLGLPFDEFAGMFSQLNRCDEDTMRAFFDRVQTQQLLDQLASCSAPRLALAISWIKDSHPEGAQRVLHAIDKSSTATHFNTLSIRKAGNTLAELNKVSHKTASRLVRQLSPQEIASWGRSAPLAQFGKTCRELAKVNRALVRSALDQIGHSALVRKFRTCDDVRTISKALNELHAVDADRAVAIFDDLNTSDLMTFLSTVAAKDLGRSLRELGIVSPSTIREIAHDLDIESVASDIVDTDFVQVGHTVSEIASADERLGKCVYEAIPMQTLVHLAKCARGRFLHQCNACTNLAKVEGGSESPRTVELLRTLGVPHFFRLASRARFEELGNGLYHLTRIDGSFARNLLGLIPGESLESKAWSECQRSG